MTSPNHHALTCMSGCEFQAAGSWMTVMINYSVMMKFLTSPTDKFKLNCEYKQKQQLLLDFNLDQLLLWEDKAFQVQLRNQPKLPFILLGLALLTLSLDKNWDSHSPMNGYPSFYPGPGHRSAATAKAWLRLRSESYDLYEPVVSQVIIMVSADLLMAWRLFGTSKTIIHHHLWHLIVNRRHNEKSFERLPYQKRELITFESINQVLFAQSGTKPNLVAKILGKGQQNWQPTLVLSFTTWLTQGSLLVLLSNGYQLNLPTLTNALQVNFLEKLPKLVAIQIKPTLNILVKTLHLYYKKDTKVGSQNFAYQIWFCTRLLKKHKGFWSGFQFWFNQTGPQSHWLIFCWGINKLIVLGTA